MNFLKNTLLNFLFVFTLIGAYGQTYSIRVVVENIEGKNGQLMIGLFDRPSDFKSKTNPVRAVETRIKNSTVSCKFLNVPSGNYAIAVFHDANGDGILNTKSMKIPTEGVAVSGNAAGKLRFARFEDAVFHLKNDTLISVRMRYPGSK
ncbi:MAG: DUF2141 domain-containing protein [Bacteroidales bacterium]|nr:DUF2141 domain-containing protein [Bacteroidales bacterium]